MKKLIFPILLLSMLLTVGCHANADFAESATDPAVEQSTDTNDGTQQSVDKNSITSLSDIEAKEITDADISNIHAGMTVREALQLLGKPGPDVFSAVYPVNYQWQIGDSEWLHIVFETDDMEYCSGSTPLGETIQMGTQEFLDSYFENLMNCTAVAAYRKGSNEKDGFTSETLFDIQPN